MQNNEKIACVKTSAPFKLADLIVYAVIGVLILSLFLGFVILPSFAKVEGVNVYLDGNKILTCSFNGQVTASNGFTNFEHQLENEKLTVKIFTNEQDTQFNVLVVDIKNKSAKVTESTCSTNKDCVHCPPIVNGSGAIICAPHKLKIVPDGSGVKPPETHA